MNNQSYAISITRNHPFETTEAVIVQVADAYFRARPDRARRDSLENYLKRLEDWENIAELVQGQRKTYVIQDGRRDSGLSEAGS